MLVVVYALACLSAWAAGYPTGKPEQEPVASNRQQRQVADNRNDVVDFGAHTGDNGSFGWYADFPVYANAD